MFTTFLLPLLLLWLPSTAIGYNDVVEFAISEDTNAAEIADRTCQARYQYCHRLTKASIDRYKHETHGVPLIDWRYNTHCGCHLPPQQQLNQLQYLHIPKTGTSINWLFHQYFHECPLNETSPCSQYLTDGVALSKGLCNGRLFSCAGHRVDPQLPHQTLRDRTNIVTMLRHPFNRLQSDYYYLKSKPWSEHLGPEINTTHLLATARTLIDYTAYPGISNCATKMLNGIQCAEDFPIDESHLDVAKRVLMAMLWFGITEYYKTSVCQFSFIYGGDPGPLQFKRSREGAYQYQAMETVFNVTEQQRFLHNERFDLSLYDFALNVFLSRQSSISCSILD